MNREKWLNRVVFLETVAGVPGIVGGMIRHLNSLRLMRRDNGWIHTLLEEVRPESNLCALHGLFLCVH
jgi:threonyl-tRNA synthetase